MGKVNDKLQFGRIPPQAPELEEAVLGVLMLEKDKMVECMSILPSAEMFYKDSSQKTYAALLRLVEKGIPTDMLTVTEELRKSNELEIVGGPYYITNLSMNVVSGAHLVSHARIVAEKFMQRELIRVAGNIISQAYEDSTDPIELCSYAQEELIQVANVHSVDDWQSVQQATIALTNHMDEAKNNPMGVTTGFSKLDKENGGFQGGMLIILAARPSMGKSAVMGGMAIAAAQDEHTVGIISLEMPTTAVYGRMVSSESDVRFKDIFFNDLTPKNEPLVSNAMNRLSKLKMYFSDTARVNILDIASKAHKLHKKHGLDILFIDFIQLVEATDKKQIREQVISQISRGLKILAMVLDIPIVALAQLNRDSEKEKRKPRTSDLRESGALEQDADVIMFLHRDFRMGILQDEHGNSTEKEADLIVPKWRNGSPCDIKLHFDPPTMTFSEPQDEINFDNPAAGIRGRTDFNTDEPPNDYN